MVSVRTTKQLNELERVQVLEFLDAAHELDCAQLNDHLHIDLTHGPRPGFVAALASDEGGQLVGYGQASAGNAGHVMDAIVSSQYDGDQDALLADVLRRLLDEFPADCRVTWWAHDDPSSQAVGAALGLQRDRQLLMMEAPLPVATTSRVTVRPFRVGTDESSWLIVNNAAFAAHGEQGGWDPTLQQRQAEDWFDPDGFLLHERDGRLAGFCWVKMHPASGAAPTGEIYVIAVHPDFHGLGLGRDLTVAGLEYMSTLGAGTAMLYVDATNTAAVNLYRSLGFETAHTEQSYLRPARS